ncbi:MAG: TonB family protein [Acidobacteriota bacterium]
MGKIVKYCGSCDEGFAEKFGFCPDCGTQLQTFEMNPAEGEIETISAEPQAVEAEIDATPVEVAPEIPAPVFLQADEDEVQEIDEPEEETAPLAAAASAPVFYQTSPAYVDDLPNFLKEAASWDHTHADEGDFRVTVIEDKNGKQRNGLLLGAAALVLFLTVGSWGVSLFQKELGVGAIGNDGSLAYLIDEVPAPVEPEPKKNKDTGGGGGGGGGDNPNPVSKGEMPPMMKNPPMAPSTSMDRLTNPTIPIQMAIKGPDLKNTADKYGYNTSRFDLRSDGAGTLGGIGDGTNGGWGSGKNSGGGAGSDGGLGGGKNGGIGDGDGPGDGGRSVPPPVVAKVTTPYKITFQPKATYTDTARSNNVQGAVRLKITLLASGQVGSIVPVTRLPDGLTEKAIAAAKQIRFEPKMVNGQPVSVVVTREYTFTIY